MKEFFGGASLGTILVAFVAGMLGDHQAATTLAIIACAAGIMRISYVIK